MEERGILYIMRSGDCVKLGKTTTKNIYGRLMSYVKDNPNLELVCFWTMPLQYISLLDIVLNEKIKKKYKKFVNFGKETEWINSRENEKTVDEIISDLKDMTLKTGKNYKVWLSYTRGYNLDLNKMKGDK